MIFGAGASGWPVKAAFSLSDGAIVNAGFAAAHQSPFVKFPIFVAIGAEPRATIILVLVGKTHRDPVAVKCPDFLDEPIVQLARPLAAQEF